MAILIYNKKKIIYYGLGKTGSTTFTNFYRPIWNNDFQTLGLNNTVSDIRKQYPKHFIFSFTRNPFDSVVSLWTRNQDNLKKAGCPNFETFVKSNNRFNTLPLMSSQLDDPTKVDFIGKYENLKSDFDKLNDILNIKYDTLKAKFDKWNKTAKPNKRINFQVGIHPLDALHKNRSSQRWNKHQSIPYQDYYTPELIKIIKERYKPDLKMFKYGFYGCKQQS